MLNELIIIKNKMSSIYDLLIEHFGFKEEWRTFYDNDYHLKLERADADNDFIWVESVINEAEDYFIAHARSVIFPMNNWWEWYNNNALYKPEDLGM